MLRYVALFLCAFFMSAGIAQAQTSNRTFQGMAFITAVHPSCGPGTEAGLSVGTFFELIYRQKVVAGDSAEALVFHSSRSSFRMASTAGSGSLVGTVTTSNAFISSRAGFGANLPGASNLTFNPSGTAAPTVANSLKVVGTVDNYFGYSGCTITIRGGITLRPD